MHVLFHSMKFQEKISVFNPGILSFNTGFGSSKKLKIPELVGAIVLKCVGKPIAKFKTKNNIIVDTLKRIK